MNPIPRNLRHLEALFDHYNVDEKGRFLGESSSFYLCCSPVLPILPPTSPKVSANSHGTSFAAPGHSTSSSITGTASSLSIGPQGQVNATVPDPLPSSANEPTLTADPLSYTGRIGPSVASLTVNNQIQDSSSPCTRFRGSGLGLGVSVVDAVVSPSVDTATGNTPAYRDPEFPVVSQSAAVLSQFPSQQLARELIVLYFSKVNRFMPIVPTLFLDEYDAGVQQSPFLLLSIFAIASKYSSDPRCRSDPMRAQTAGENYCKTACRFVDEFLDCPRLSTVQGLFLLGKHLVESRDQGVLTKSYMYFGMAVRMAVDMGLNRNCSGWGLNPIQVEYRNRTWWYLYVYDRVQGSSYGRPYLIQDQDCGAEKPKPDPLARNPAQDQEDVEHMVNLIHLSALLGRVMNNLYPTNISGSNFHCSSRSVYGHAGGRALVAGMLSNELPTSTPVSRKRSKRSSRSKSKSGEQEGGVSEAGGVGSASNGQSGQDTTTNAGRTAMGGTQSHQDMLTRQHVANQKQDVLVAELDKDLTEWVQALPPHLQWNNLQTHPNVYGDIMHGIYYVVLILLHRPSVRVGELMPTTPMSRQNKCLSESEAPMTTEGCHSMSVCSQAARRITKLAERCQNLTHLERFGAGAYILLHAARVHLMVAAIPAPARETGVGSGGCGPSAKFIEAIQRKEQAVDQFHRSLGSLRKFSIYHWTVDGISSSIRSLERTLAAILQEQEMDREQEMERQRQKLAEYDAEFFDHGNSMASTNMDMSGAKESGVILDEGTASGNKSEQESLHERTYYESMRFLEMRLLYQERHRYSKDNHLEEHLQHQDIQPLLHPGMGLVPRRGLLDAASPAMSYHSVMHNNISDLFDKNGPSAARTDGSTGASNVPGLVIRTYKPNTTGKPKRRGASNAASGSTGSTLNRSKTTANQPRSSDGISRSTITALDDSIPQDIVDVAVETVASSLDSSTYNSDGITYNTASAPNLSAYGPLSAMVTPTPSMAHIGNLGNDTSMTPSGSPRAIPVTWPSTVSGPQIQQQQQQQRHSQQDNIGSGMGPVDSIMSHTAAVKQSSGVVISGNGMAEQGAEKGAGMQGVSLGQRQLMYMSEQLFLQQHQQHQQQQLQYQQQQQQQQHQSLQVQLQSQPHQYQQQQQPQAQAQAQTSRGSQQHEQIHAQRSIQSMQPTRLQRPGPMDVQQQRQPIPQQYAQQQQQQQQSSNARNNAYTISAPMSRQGEGRQGDIDMLAVLTNERGPTMHQHSTLGNTQSPSTQPMERHLQEQQQQQQQQSQNIPFARSDLGLSTGTGTGASLQLQLKEQQQQEKQQMQRQWQHNLLTQQRQRQTQLLQQQSQQSQAQQQQRFQRGQQENVIAQHINQSTYPQQQQQQQRPQNVQQQAFMTIQDNRQIIRVQGGSGAGVAQETPPGQSMVQYEQMQMQHASQQQQQQQKLQQHQVLAYHGSTHTMNLRSPNGSQMSMSSSPMASASGSSVSNLATPPTTYSSAIMSDIVGVTGTGSRELGLGLGLGTGTGPGRGRGGGGPVMQLTGGMGTGTGKSASMDTTGLNGRSDAGGSDAGGSMYWEQFR